MCLEKPQLQYAKLSTAYNRKLKEHIKKFQRSHKDANVLSVDTYSRFRYKLDHPSEYGIESTTTYCPNSTAADIDTNYAAYGCLPMH